MNAFVHANLDIIQKKLARAREERERETDGMRLLPTMVMRSDHFLQLAAYIALQKLKISTFDIIFSCITTLKFRFT